MKRAALLVVVGSAVYAQAVVQRGFIENLTTVYPQTATSDSGRVVNETLLRWEAAWEAAPWLKLNAALDARVDTHRQVDRTFDFSLDDRHTQRPALALRRFSAIAHKDRWTVEAGRQFIRWGRADILNPEDRFAPKDFLNVVNADFLGVWAVRATYERGADTLEAVIEPWFTPSRVPLWNQRWTVLPTPLPLADRGADYPARPQFGARWNHAGRGYEVAASYFDGFNHLPGVRLAGFDFVRVYPRLRLYGADAAIPTRWATVKTEAAYFESQEKYLLYVVQLERQQGGWVVVAGYSGEMVTRSTKNVLEFSPERGMAKTLLGRAEYSIGPVRTITFTGAVRQDGRGVWARGEYSQAVGRHWRATAGVTWIHGNPTDFIGQYHRNSYASLALRYSF